MIIQIINPRERIGDFLGTLPPILELTKSHEVYLQTVPALQEILPFLPPEIRLGTHPHPDKTYTISIDAAQSRWEQWHIPQAYYEQLDLPVPKECPTIPLNVPYKKVPTYDYVIAPYSVSLPWGHLWTSEKWDKLISSFPLHRFALIGSKTDPKLGWHHNLKTYLGHPWLDVLNIIRNAKCVISVPSAISHFTYALGTPHILFINQPAWSQNPEAKAQLTNYLINEIEVDTVIEVLKRVRKGQIVGDIGEGNYIKGQTLS
jgi:hypothetical protein